LSLFFFVFVFFLGFWDRLLDLDFLHAGSQILIWVFVLFRWFCELLWSYLWLVFRFWILGWNGSRGSVLSSRRWVCVCACAFCERRKLLCFGSFILFWEVSTELCWMYIFLALVVGSFYFLNIGSSGSLTTSEEDRVLLLDRSFLLCSSSSSSRKKATSTSVCMVLAMEFSAVFSNHVKQKKWACVKVGAAVSVSILQTGKITAKKLPEFFSLSFAFDDDSNGGNLTLNQLVTIFLRPIPW
jgi:hypothetical protein